MHIAEDFVGVRVIDFSPIYEIGEIKASPETTVAAAGLRTAKDKSLDDIIKKLIEKPKKVETFHRESTNRGHASILTTPQIYIDYWGSRMLDLYVSAHPYGSYLITSTRRIGVTNEDIIIPRDIVGTSFENKYLKVWKEYLILYKKIKKIGGYDAARNILPLGIPSKGFCNISLQTAFTLIYEAKKTDYIPNEILEFSDMLEVAIKKLFPTIYESSSQAYYTGYPFPNIFGGTLDIPPEGLGFRVIIYKLPDKSLIRRFGVPKNEDDWKRLAKILQLELLVEVLGEISIAGYNELKRHRTVLIRVESVYNSIERFLAHQREEQVYIPSVLEKDSNRRLRRDYLDRIFDGCSLYKEMVDSGIYRGSALYIVPHAIKVGFKMILNGYHVFDPYGLLGVRLCSKAHEEIRNFVKKVGDAIIAEMPELEPLIGPKCKMGYCTEREPCGIWKKYAERIKSLKY